MQPTVLLLTHSADTFGVDRVAEALTQRGARPLRLNTDDYPGRVQLSQQFGAPETAGPLADRLWLDGTPLATGEVRAVWTRQIWKPRLDPQLPDAYRGGCERAAAEGLTGWLDGLRHARWINQPAAIRQAASKPRQLRIAQRCGLRVPRTLITNSPEQVRAFYDEVGGQMITKMLVSLTTGMTPSAMTFRTTAVQPEDLDALDGLRHCPMIFQERIEKRSELRIAWVAGQALAGAVHAPERTDWRTSDPAEVRWTPAPPLPPAVARSLRALMEALGLAFGAIDMICTPAGELVFLEVNATGEWGMLERDLGLPISAAIADALLDGR